MLEVRLMRRDGGTATTLSLLDNDANRVRTNRERGKAMAPRAKCPVCLQSLISVVRNNAVIHAVPCEECQQKEPI